MKVRSLWMLCVLAVVGCGGGGGGDPPPATPVSTNPAPNPSPNPSPAPVVVAPSNLSYVHGSAYVVGTAIGPLTPTVTGTVTSYGVSPALPNGVTLNTSTGVIAGTPTAPAATATYVVTASNSAGSTTFSLVFGVVTPVPPVPAPSALSYPSPRTYQVGTAIAPLSPTVTGTVASYSVTPALPPGLTLNPGTGVISGTPTHIVAQTAYLVRAGNATGSTTFSLVLTVLAAPAPTMTLTTSATQVAVGGSATLTWTSSNTTSCTASGGWSGTKATSGSESIVVSATATYTLTCFGAGTGNSIFKFVSITAVQQPRITLTPDRTMAISGARAQIEYTVWDAQQCTSQGSWNVSFNGGGQGSYVNGRRDVGPITADSDFGLTCTNTAGQVAANVRITLSTQPNDAPVANDDSHTVAEDSGTVFVSYEQLVANDVDTEGRFGPARYMQSQLMSGSSSVSIWYVSDDGILFVLAPNGLGPVTYRYRVEDDIGQLSNYATLTVTITPNDDAPILVTDTGLGIRNLPFEIDVVANDQQLDLPVSIQVAAAPARGTATVSTTSGRELIRYVPQTDYEGADAFEYRLTDADGDTATAVVNVTVGPTMRVSPAARFARLGVAEPWDWTCDANATARTWSNLVYDYFEDSFDFIIFLARTSRTCNLGIAGQHVAARNDVSGIGRPLHDNTALFGSSGRLRSVLWLQNTGYLLSGPSLHEIAHAWGNFIANTEPASVGPHWGFSSGGQLGGFAPHTLEDLGGGQYRANNGAPGSTSFGLNANGGNSIPYGELELYLMGLRVPTGVPDLVIARGADFVSSGVFTATSLERRTIDDIIAQHGARVPAFATSQKEFRALVVVITDSEMRDTEYTTVDAAVEEFGRPSDDGIATRYNFWEATRGVGRLLMEGIDQELR